MERRTLVALTLTITVCGCDMFTGPVPPEAASFTCVSDAPAVNLPDSLAVGTEPSRGGQGPWVVLARTVPGGFAGLYFDHSQMILNFTDTTAARSSLLEVKRQLGLPDSYWASAALGQVKWNYAQLGDWLGYSAFAVFDALPTTGSFFVGIDIAQNRIEMLVPDEDSRVKLDAALAAAQVPCNLIWTGVYSPQNPVTP